jgi:hypothetical protein
MVQPAAPTPIFGRGVIGEPFRQETIRFAESFDVAVIGAGAAEAA